MNRDQKAAVIDRVAGQIEAAEAIFAVDYRGLTVKQSVELRGSLGDADASFQVVKNTLTERAADKAGAPGLKELLDGPTALTFVSGDVAVAAKALAVFRRQAGGVPQFKGGQLAGQPLSVEQIEDIARLPARDVLQGQFVGVLASPLTGLVRGLASLLSGVAVALRQIEERGLVGGASETDAPAAEAADAGEAPAAETPAEAETADEPPAEAPGATDAPEPPPAEEAGEPDAAGAAEAPAGEQPSEAPGDPVAEAEAAEEESETPSEGEQTAEEG